jgi:hypothetical protein
MTAVAAAATAATAAIVTGAPLSVDVCLVVVVFVVGLYVHLNRCK